MILCITVSSNNSKNNKETESQHKNYCEKKNAATHSALSHGFKMLKKADKSVNKGPKSVEKWMKKLNAW